MHYPVMAERQLALRWKISLKTLRRWRLDGEGPSWHKLFQHVRYHVDDPKAWYQAALIAFREGDYVSACTHRRRGIGLLHEFYLREAAKAVAAIRTMLGCKVPNLGFCPCGAWGGTEK